MTYLFGIGTTRTFPIGLFGFTSVSFVKTFALNFAHIFYLIFR
jgi:hypothetical protein